jgi:D-alanyl-D-alanine carboxypeptidase (penicillin-binding protein 5/6)
LSAEIKYKGPLRTPIKKGDAVATLMVTGANDATAEVQLFAAEDVAASGFVKRGLHSLYYMLRRAVPL